MGKKRALVLIHDTVVVPDKELKQLDSVVIATIFPEQLSNEIPGAHSDRFMKKLEYVAGIVEERARKMKKKVKRVSDWDNTAKAVMQIAERENVNQILVSDERFGKNLMKGTKGKWKISSFKP